MTSKPLVRRTLATLRSAEFCVPLEVPVIEKPDPLRRADQHRALVVEPCFQGFRRPAALVEKPLRLVVQDEGRVSERDVDALRAVLEIPAAMLVCGVVAR